VKRSYLLLILAIIALVLFNTLHEKPKRLRESNAILFANPLVFKALSGATHNLLADSLWLLSNTVSEMNGRSTEDVDMDELTKASRTISFMDPYFHEANNYATMLIAGYGRDLTSALSLIRLQRFFDHNNFRLYFDELIFLLTYAIDYGMDIDYDYIISLAKKAATLPDSKNLLGQIKINSWIDDILVAANSRLNRQQQALDDLIWLKKNTKNEHRKKEINKRIQQLKKDMNQSSDDSSNL
jgi:hypothetical protein